MSSAQSSDDFKQYTQPHKSGSSYWDKLVSEDRTTHIYQIPSIKVYPVVLQDLSRLLPARVEQTRRGERGFFDLVFDSSPHIEYSEKRCFFGKSTNGRTKYLTFKFVGKEKLLEPKISFDLHFHIIKENPPKLEFSKYELDEDFTVYDPPKDISKHARKLSKSSPEQPYKSLEELVHALKFYKNIFVSDINGKKYILEDDVDIEEEDDVEDISLDVLDKLEKSLSESSKSPIQIGEVNVDDLSKSMGKSLGFPEKDKDKEAKVKEGDKEAFPSKEKSIATSQGKPKAEVSSPR